VKVHYGEGVAIRIGPEPCAGTREGDGEGSIGEHRGVRTANGFVATLALVSLCRVAAGSPTARCDSGPASVGSTDLAVNCTRAGRVPCTAGISSKA
jgi:hypothetical protein